MKRRLSEITNELERAVFLSVYASWQQRWRRALARLLLVLKHLLWGWIFALPIALMLAALLFLPVGEGRLFYLLMLAPGVLIWLRVYLKGARSDYALHVQGRLLGKGFLRKLLWR